MSISGGLRYWISYKVVDMFSNAAKKKSLKIVEIEIINRSFSDSITIMFPHILYNAVWEFFSDFYLLYYSI